MGIDRITIECRGIPCTTGWHGNYPRHDIKLSLTLNQLTNTIMVTIIHLPQLACTVVQAQLFNYQLFNN